VAANVSLSPELHTARRIIDDLPWPGGCLIRVAEGQLAGTPAAAANGTVDSLQFAGVALKLRFNLNVIR
jgi:hypothetical protein